MQPSSFSTGADSAAALDAQDRLRSFRSAFHFPDPDLLYLDGNSLGRLPAITASRIREVVEAEWGRELIRGWNAGWYAAPRRVGDMIGRLIGAAPGQVLVTDSTSVNLFKLVLAALALRPERTRVVSDVLNFPSDLYVLQGCLHLLGGGRSLDLIPSSDGIAPDETGVQAAIDGRTALVSLSHVAFKSGYLYDAEAVTGMVHAAGALTLWDLSHSVGVVPIKLDHWGVDLAVGCTYKYLNGGPGAPAFLYIRRELQEQLSSPIWGWFGQRRPFDFNLEYQPAAGVERFLAGTPPILSLLAMEAALQIVLEAGVDRIRRKSIDLTSYLVDLSDALLVPLGFALASPRDPARRGSHVSLRHPEGYRISRALAEEMDVLGDFREPDNLRLGLSPLTTAFRDVWQAVDRIRCVIEDQRFRRYSVVRPVVT